MIIFISIGIAIISIGWAVWSWYTLGHNLKTKETKKELQKGRVIFHSSDVSSSSRS